MPLLNRYLLPLFACFSASVTQAQEVCVVDCPDSQLPLQPTLVVTEPRILDAFDLRRTLQRIVQTAGSSTSPTTPEALLDSLRESFEATSLPHPHRGSMTVPLRLSEAALTVQAMLGTGSDALVPVALFNRFDLAPANGQHCGEYRIVYARKGGRPQQLGRLFLIFEAALDNPHPNNPSACVEVARFWAGLNSLSLADQRTALTNFYYVGLDSDGDSVPDFKPAIHALHFGLPNGQVRGNIFMQAPWQLREWRLSGTRPLTFSSNVINDTPLPDVLEPTGTEANRFRVEVLSHQVSRLLAPESAAISEGCAPDERQVLNDFSSEISDRFLAFTQDSVLGGTTLAVSQPLLQIYNQWASNYGPLSARVTGEHLANRMTVLTCAGCHQTPANRKISATVDFPENLDFVHVDEEGRLSRALTDTFLPHRLCVLGRAGIFDSAMTPALAIDPSHKRIMPSVDGKASALFRAVRRELLDEMGGIPETSGIRSTEIPASGESIDDLIDRARAAERLLPGAFDPVRRPHG